MSTHWKGYIASALGFRLGTKASSTEIIDLNGDYKGRNLVPTGDVTIVANKTLAVTTADKLTHAGVISPRFIHATVNIPAGAAAADYDGLFFIADAAYEVVAVRERHGVAGNDAGAVTLMVNKVPSGTAKAAGTAVLAAGIDLKAAADTNQSPALHATVANTQLAAGDALGIVPTGTLTAVDAVTVTVWLKRI